MPHFYFHLATPQSRQIDEVGCRCPSADDAVIEAWRAAVEIGADRARRGRASTNLRFEVCDPAGRLVFELPFSDVFDGGSGRPPGLPTDRLRERLAETLQRNRTLREEVAEAVEDVRSTLNDTRALLARRK